MRAAQHHSWHGITRGWRRVSLVVLLYQQLTVHASLSFFTLCPFRLLQRTGRRTMMTSPMVKAVPLPCCPPSPVHLKNNLHCAQILGCQNGQKLINLVLLEMMNVLKVAVIGLLEQHLCSSRPINVIRNICIARLHSIHAAVGWPRHFEEDRTEIMLYDNQPIPCLLSAPV